LPFLRDKLFSMSPSSTSPQVAHDSPQMRKLRKRTYGTAKIRSERGKSAPERRSVEHALACSGDLHPGWPFVIDTSPGEPPAPNPSRPSERTALLLASRLLLRSSRRRTRSASRLLVSLVPFRDESLVRSRMSQIADAPAGRVIGLRGVAQLMAQMNLV